MKATMIAVPAMAARMSRLRVFTARSFPLTRDLRRRGRSALRCEHIHHGELGKPG